MASIAIVNTGLAMINKSKLGDYADGYNLSLNPIQRLCQVRSLQEAEQEMGGGKETRLSARIYANKCDIMGRNQSSVDETRVSDDYSDGSGSGGRIELKKPILYLYPKETTDIQVKLQYPERITTQYPKYGADGWKVTAQPNGDLTDAQGKKYYAIYWEESKPEAVDFSQGFYVEKDRAADFLEAKLTEIGLNDRERNEFIMYWLPKLEENPASLVSFVLTEDLQQTNELKIYPAPDSLLRVHIHIKSTTKNTNPIPQTFAKFDRQDFSAVEWGGTDHDR